MKKEQPIMTDRYPMACLSHSSYDHRGLSDLEIEGFEAIMREEEPANRPGTVWETPKGFILPQRFPHD
jgi:hypothetical protein